MDNDSRKKLKQFWQKRLLFGLGTVGFLGLGWATIGLMRSTYDDLQIAEGRGVPVRFYQEQMAIVRQVADLPPSALPSKAQSSDAWNPWRSLPACQAIAALKTLKDERAIPELGKLLKDDRNRAKSCDSSYSSAAISYVGQSNSVYVMAADALGQFQTKEAETYLKAAAIKPVTPEITALWQNFANEKDQNSSPSWYREYVVSAQQIAVLKSLA